eukprot:1181127-Amphidinium_carterae.2
MAASTPYIDRNSQFSPQKNVTIGMAISSVFWPCHVSVANSICTIKSAVGEVEIHVPDDAHDNFCSVHTHPATPSALRSPMVLAWTRTVECVCCIIKTRSVDGVISIAFACFYSHITRQRNNLGLKICKRQTTFRVFFIHSRRIS